MEEEGAPPLHREGDSLLSLTMCRFILPIECGYLVESKEERASFANKGCHLWKIAWRPSVLYRVRCTRRQFAAKSRYEWRLGLLYSFFEGFTVFVGQFPVDSYRVSYSTYCSSQSQ
eukprot:Gb_19171 [translate_table: standard]